MATAKGKTLGDPGQAARVRREADARRSMRERLARVHRLSKQVTAIKGAAARH